MLDFAARQRTITLMLINLITPTPRGIIKSKAIANISVYLITTLGIEAARESLTINKSFINDIALIQSESAEEKLNLL